MAAASFSSIDQSDWRAFAEVVVLLLAEIVLLVVLVVCLWRLFFAPAGEVTVLTTVTMEVSVTVEAGAVTTVGATG